MSPLLSTDSCLPLKTLPFRQLRARKMAKGLGDGCREAREAFGCRRRGIAGGERGGDACLELIDEFHHCAEQRGFHFGNGTHGIRVQVVGGQYLDQE